MMLKKEIVLLTLILVILIPGCAIGQKNPQSGDISHVDYHTGSQGLVLNFLPGTPPPSVYRGNPLSIIVEYSNKGAVDISNGRLYISGFDPNYIQFSPPWNMQLAATGKSEFNPLGELSNTFEFYEDAVNMPAQVDTYTPQFLVTACYKYQTEAFDEVCIDPDPYGIAPQEKVCTTRNVAFGTQGAPIAVTSAEVISSRDRVQFKIHVSNVGGGTIISPNRAIDNCHTSLKRTDIDKVSIVASFSNKMLNCEPSLIQLVNGNGISVCSYEGNLGTSAYLTLLNINLYYGYRTSIQGSTNVYKIPGRN